MLLSVVLALFLPCAGMTIVFIAYICLLCYAARYHHQTDPPVKPATQNGLSSGELEKLPVAAGKDLVLGVECAVCLDDVEPEQLARMFPGCNHGFHLQCADMWLSKNPVCPVCRNKLDDSFFVTRVEKKVTRKLDRFPRQNSLEMCRKQCLATVFQQN